MPRSVVVKLVVCVALSVLALTLVLPSAAAPAVVSFSVASRLDDLKKVLQRKQDILSKLASLEDRRLVWLRRYARKHDLDLETVTLADLPTGDEDWGIEVIDIMEAIVDNRNQTFVINVPNDGAIPNLPDGAIVEVNASVNAYGIRPIQAEDSLLLADIFDRLSPASRLARFLIPKRELTATELRYFTDVDHHNHIDARPLEHEQPSSPLRSRQPFRSPLEYWRRAVSCSRRRSARCSCQ